MLNVAISARLSFVLSKLCGCISHSQIKWKRNIKLNAEMREKRILSTGIVCCVSMCENNALVDCKEN